MSAAESGLRADAARNREKLLDAAREVFTEQGLDASMRQIARHAGVSEPTLRRRFPHREELVAEAFQDKIAAYADAAETALADADSWNGFAGLVRTLARMQLSDRGFADVLTMTFPHAMRAEEQRLRAYSAITLLVERAKAADVLRPDFSPEDLVLLLMAHAGVVAASGSIAEPLSDRVLAYFLDAFAAPGRSELPPAPSVAATYRALLRLHSDS